MHLVLFRVESFPRILINVSLGDLKIVLNFCPAITHRISVLYVIFMAYKLT